MDVAFGRVPSLAIAVSSPGRTRESLKADPPHTVSTEHGGFTVRPRQQLLPRCNLYAADGFLQSIVGQLDERQKFALETNLSGAVH